MNQTKILTLPLIIGSQIIYIYIYILYSHKHLINGKKNHDMHLRKAMLRGVKKIVGRLLFFFFFLGC